MKQGVIGRKLGIGIGLVTVMFLFTGCVAVREQFSTLPCPTEYGPTAETMVITNRLNPAWLKPSTNQFTLGPGDRVEIELIGETNSVTDTLVCPDGKVYFNVLSGVDVWGKTIGEAKALIETELANHIRNDPRVTITLRAVESKRIWMLGRVQSPGVYPLNGPTTLLEALAGAGGTMTLIGQRDIPLSTAVEDLADMQRSFVMRKGKVLPLDFDRLMNKGDLSQNIYLEPDDFIYLPPATAKEVYVIGAVGQPRSVPWMENTTLATAIAYAYGTVKESYESQVGIIRGSMAEPQLTVVNYLDIVHGRRTDVPLKPGDIVYVPYSPYRFLVRFAEAAMNTFAASVAINAGSQIILRQPAQPAGIFIPVGSRITVVPSTPPPTQ